MRVKIGEVGGVLVSHAHVDHIGSIHQLRGGYSHLLLADDRGGLARAAGHGRQPIGGGVLLLRCRVEKDGGGLYVAALQDPTLRGPEIPPDRGGLSGGFRAFWDEARRVLGSWRRWIASSSAIARG